MNDKDTPNPVQEPAPDQEPQPQPTVSFRNKKPKSKFAKKTTIISGVVILLVALAAGGWYFFNQQTATVTTEQPEQDITELSQDFGACSTLDKTFVQTTLGDSADTLKGPLSSGIIDAGEGNRAHVCVYPFAQEGSLEENFFNINNSFNIEIYVFANLEKADNATSLIIESELVESEIADKVTYFAAVDSEDPARRFTLYVHKGIRQYIFQISQPTAAVTYDIETAKTALLAIAGSVTLN